MLRVIIPALLIATAPAIADTESDMQTFHTWAATPPMGWNSWDCFGPTVTEDEVKANADYMAEHLLKHGWEYIVVDIRWYVRQDKAHGYTQNPEYVMDEYGRLWPADNRFPSAADGKGFTALADYVHGKGLKLGMHLMRGIPVEAVKRNTKILGTDLHAQGIHSTELQCAWLKDMYTVDASKPGAQEYYDSVIALYASWGVDYLKIDDLSRPYHEKEIELIRKAIDKTGRPIVLSTSPGATPLDAAEHVSRHANLWRICDDFWDDWAHMYPQFERCANWAPWIGVGHWPDYDMLPLGRIGIRAERGNDRMTGFTRDEQVTLMTICAITRSPLMFGGHLPGNDEWTLQLITNDEVLAVNQHSANNRQLSREDDLIIWVADIPDAPDKYVACFNANSGEEERPIDVDIDGLGLGAQAVVRDLWQREDIGTFGDAYTVTLRPHAAALLRLSPAE